MRKDAKYIYPELEAAIVRSRKRPTVIAKALGMEPRTLNHRRSGVSDWKLREMLAVRELVAPDMILDDLFERKEVPRDGTV